MKPTSTFVGDVWLWNGEKGSWHFITVPADISQDIKKLYGTRKGFGSVRVKVKIGSTVWKTSIFPSSETQTYCLPLKADVRTKENICDKDCVSVQITLLDVG